MINNIAQLPFELITENSLPDSVLLSKAAFNHNFSWIFPQLLSHLGTYTFKPNPLDFLTHNVGRDPRELGIWRLLTKINRSDLISFKGGPVANKDKYYYGSLVPLYMAAQKKFNNIPYSAWENCSELAHILPEALFKAMTLAPLDYSYDSLMELREKGLQDKSPLTTHRLTGITNTWLSKVPMFAQAMLCQIWHAHPVNRNEYMVLDPWDWDKMPDMLVDTALFDPVPEYKEPVKKPLPKTNDIPWL